MVLDFCVYVFILFNYSRPVFVHILSFKAGSPGPVENSLKCLNSFCTGNKDMNKRYVNLFALEVLLRGRHRK